MGPTTNLGKKTGKYYEKGKLCVWVVGGEREKVRKKETTKQNITTLSEDDEEGGRPLRLTSQRQQTIQPFFLNLLLPFYIPPSQFFHPPPATCYRQQPTTFLIPTNKGPSFLSPFPLFCIPWNPLRGRC
ncbi:hypothetical protein RJT34_03518 [Clitoria ternatea]|uniref:Uncharacterized protein n=1 Tax=Clitoria ternatea TaxID=43366 RepID=A0AAN9KKX4_CLITE